MQYPFPTWNLLIPILGLQCFRRYSFKQNKCLLQHWSGCTSELAKTIAITATIDIVAIINEITLELLLEVSLVMLVSLVSLSGVHRTWLGRFVEIGVVGIVNGPIFEKVKEEKVEPVSPLL